MTERKMEKGKLPGLTSPAAVEVDPMKRLIFFYPLEVNARRCTQRYFFFDVITHLHILGVWGDWFVHPLDEL